MKNLLQDGKVNDTMVFGYYYGDSKILVQIALELLRKLFSQQNFSLKFYQKGIQV